jgi:glucosamine--fructose-6-phosphate aminotransferase (isomerizing)
MTAKYWIEQLAGIPVEVDIASEFRYRKPALQKGGLTLLISQSGETADTLAALKYAKEKGQHIAAIVNVQQSSIAREADFIMPTLAGPEIGVASTKAFTAQLTCLAALAMALAKKHNPQILHDLVDVPAKITEILHNKDFEKVAAELAKAKTILYIGRGTSYPIALEGALKLKEISYIHSEGFGAGELKHGPIALIDRKVPVVVIAPHDEYFAKTASNVAEVVARGGKVILVSDKKGCKELKDIAFRSIEMPTVSSFVSALIYSVPVQLLAYYTALHKGTDVDQPRNLAKSVTVE